MPVPEQDPRYQEFKTRMDGLGSLSKEDVAASAAIVGAVVLFVAADRFVPRVVRWAQRRQAKRNQERRTVPPRR